MWRSFLQPLVSGKRCSRKSRRAQPQTRRIIPRLDYLEDRTLLSTLQVTNLSDSASFTAGDGSLRGEIAAAQNGYTIQFSSSLARGTLTLNSGQLVINKSLSITGLTSSSGTPEITISGNNASRIFDVASGATVSLEGRTLSGGMVNGSTAQGGAVYNSGNLSMKSVVVAGNQAIGGSGQNAQGGGIYSNGGFLALVNDVIGRTVERSSTTTLNFKTYTGTTQHSTKTIGAANNAEAGTGGSGQGGGLYVVGGTVNVSNCTIGDNEVSGSVSAQGGGIYATGVPNLTLKNDVIGLESVQKSTISPAGATSAAVTAITSSSKKIGSANKATGGSAMGAGLYVSGGTVSVSQGAIAGNHAAGGAGQNAVGGGGNGGNAQGGGIYAYNASLSLTGGTIVDRNAIQAGQGGNGTADHLAGGQGGNAQGGGVFASATTVIINSGSTIFNNDAHAGAGGRGGNGRAAPQGATLNQGGTVGGQGGNGGLAQGGGLYANGGKVTITNTNNAANNIAIGFNEVVGGLGGAGGNGGVGVAVGQTGGVGGAGGVGGEGDGGGIYINAAPLTASGGVTLATNVADGGAGGLGGKGGYGWFEELGTRGTVKSSYGGNGGIGGIGGIGGAAQGGGLFAAGSGLTSLSAMPPVPSS